MFSQTSVILSKGDGVCGERGVRGEGGCAWQNGHVW